MTKTLALIAFALVLQVGFLVQLAAL